MSILSQYELWNKNKRTWQVILDTIYCSIWHVGSLSQSARVIIALWKFNLVLCCLFLNSNSSIDPTDLLLISLFILQRLDATYFSLLTLPPYTVLHEHGSRGGSQITFASLGGWVGGWSKICWNCKLCSIKSKTFRWMGGQKFLKIANVTAPDHNLIV